MFVNLISKQSLAKTLIASCVLVAVGCSQPTEDSNSQATENAKTSSTKSNTEASKEQSAATAQASDVHPIEARIDSMYDWKTAMSIMGGMIKKPEKFNAQSFQSEADFLAKNNDNAWQYFADKQAGLGNATEEIWNNPEKWQAEIDKFKQATTELQAVSQTAAAVDDVNTAFAKVEESCKSCHVSFTEY